MSEVNRYKRLADDTILMAAGSFSSKVLVFLLLPLYTYVLSTEDYGIADLFTTTISMLIPILSFSVSEATFRFAFETDIDQGKNLATSLAMVALSCILLVPTTAALSYWNGYFTYYFGYFFFLYSSNAFYLCLSNYSRGVDKIRTFVLGNVIYTVILVILNILFLTVIKIGLEGYLLAISFAYTGGGIFIFVSVSGHKKFRLAYFDTRLLVHMLKFSCPLIISTVAWWGMNSIDKYLIIGLIGIEESGVFGVAQKLPTIISVIGSIFVQAWQISAIKVKGHSDADKFYTNVYRAYEVGLYITAALLIAFTIPLAKVLFQKDYFIAYTYAPLLILSGVFSCQSSFMTSPFIAEKKSFVLLRSTIIGLVVTIVINLLLLPTVGPIGASYATLAGFFCTWLFRLIPSRKYVTIKVDWKKTLPTLFLLLIEALLVSYDFPFVIPVSILIIIGIALINIRVIVNVTNIAIAYIDGIRKQLIRQ